MYQILLDGRDLYYPSDRDYAVTNAIVDLQLNDVGALEFEIPQTNPEYDNIKNRISNVQVLKNGEELFCGEVREIEKDICGNKCVYVIGELAYLMDSIQPQAKFQNKTARQLVEAWIAVHNSQVEAKKQFKVGIVTVHDTNDRLYRFTNQENTLDCLREKICKKLNGYLRVRKVNGERFLDVIPLNEYGKICEQSIEFGKNLLDYAENISASNLYTCVIPKGARLEKSLIEGLESYVDITSVNGGKDFIYNQTAVDTFGWNRCVVSFNDVNVPQILKTKAEKWLSVSQFEEMTLSLSAVDLSLLDKKLDFFEIGDIVCVYSKPHGMNRTFPVQKMRYNLLDPKQDRIELGTKTLLSFTEQSKGQYNDLSEQIQEERKTTSFLQSAIDNATQMMTGSKGGYKVTEFDSDGRWLRDLYMNAQTKEQATQVMQINMNGIGFSNTGFAGPYKNAWTIDGQLLGEFIKAGTINAEKLSVEYKNSITSRFEVAEGMISASVSKNDIGSYVQQHYDKVILGFNNSSKYVQINPGSIGIYNYGISEQKKRAIFDENGNHFYRDSYYVGKIGTNSWADNAAHKGLVFDLETQGKYMTWAYKKNPTDNFYTTILTFSRANSIYSTEWLHVGTNLDMEGHKIINPSWESGSGITGQINFVQILAVDANGKPTLWGPQAYMRFENGILMEMNHYQK